MKGMFKKSTQRDSWSAKANTCQKQGDINVRHRTLPYRGE
jgi:hypothetical protein